MQQNKFRSLHKHLAANLKTDGIKVTERSYILQQDNDPKHTTKTIKEFIRANKWKVLDWPSHSPDLNPIGHVFYLLKKRLKGEIPQNKQQVKEAVVKAWKQQCKSLMTSLSYSYFDVKPKCFQCTNKLKELASPFQQFRRGLYIQLFTFSVRIDLYFTLISRIKYKHKTHHQISVLCHHIPLHLYCWAILSGEHTWS